MTQPVHVTFLHGLANKPAPQQLRRIWNGALAAPVAGDEGFDLGAVGVADTFTYWADVFYDTPLEATGYESRADALSGSLPQESSLPDSDWARAMLHRLEADTEPDDPPDDAALDTYERVPLPGFLKRRLMREFVREAHAYLFNVDGVRDVIRDRVLADLTSAGEGARRVLVGHSQGSFIAYDVLTAVERCPEIDGLMTLGSPLGIDEIQDQLVWSRNDGFPRKLAGEWVNVFDPYDVVSRLDPHLANDFRRDGEEVVLDVNEPNWGTWRHSATKYFRGPRLRGHLRRLCAREIPE